MAKFDGISVSMERRRTTILDDTRNVVGLTRVTCTLDVTGVGELATEVAFPVAFIAEPATWFGCVYLGKAGLSPSTEYTVGAMPVTSLVVLQWSRGTSAVQATSYVGATLGIVTGGAVGDRFRLHAHFEEESQERAGA